MAGEMCGALIDRGTRPGDALRVTLSPEMNDRQRKGSVASHISIARAQPQSMLGVVYRIRVRLIGERNCQIGVSHRRVRVQFQGSAGRTRRLGEAARSTEQVSLDQVCPRVAVVQRQRNLRFPIYFNLHRPEVADPLRTSQYRPREETVGLAI